MKVTTSIRMVWAALVSGGHLWCPVRGVNILHTLAVPVQKHHGATGLDHEAKNTQHQRWTTSRQSRQQHLRMSKTTFLGYQYSCVCSVEQWFSEEQWRTLRDWASSRCSRKGQWPWGPFLWASSTLLSWGWEWRTDRCSGCKRSTGRCWEPLSVSNTEFTSKTR